MAWVSLLVKVLIFLTRSMLQLEKFCHFLASYLVVTPVAFSPSMEVVSAISIPASDVNKNSKVSFGCAGRSSVCAACSELLCL